MKKVDYLNQNDRTAWHEQQIKEDGSHTQNRGRGSYGNKSIYGSSLKRQGGRIDVMLSYGRYTLTEIAESIRMNDATIKQAERRVKQHLYAHLRDKKGYDVQTDGHGRLYIENCYISRENHDSVIQAATLKAARQIAAQEKIKHVARVSTNRQAVKKQA